MNKLFKLKSWLTVEETAKQLTLSLGEAVTVADIYRLALDKYLVLSMYFPNHARGNLGRVVGIDEATFTMMEIGVLNPFETHDDPSKLVKFITALPLDNGQFLNWEKSVSDIEGVWDLPMIAGEYIEVEAAYNRLIGDIEVELFNIDGVFLKQGDDYCRLVVGRDENQNYAGSLAHKRALELEVELGNIPQKNLAATWERFDRDRKKFLEEQKSLPNHERYESIYCLPDDGIYVVRQSAILDFLSSINDTKVEEKPLTTKGKNSYLSLIAVLAKQAGYDLSQKGIATSLETATQQLDCPVGDDTIRKIIKEVNELTAKTSV